MAVKINDIKSPLVKLTENQNYPPNVSPEKKGEEYHRKWAEKIYSLLASGKTWIPNEVYSKIDVLRAYSNGRQSNEEVKDWLLGKSEKPQDISQIDAAGFDMRGNASTEERRKAWINIDFSPISVAPKIKTKINEFIRSMYYEMSVNAIDSYSVKSEEHEKYRLWFFKQNQEWMTTQMEAVALQPEQPEFMPENLEELELYAATGGFKVPYAVSMEDLIRHTFDISDWDKEIAERIRDDLFTLGHAIIKEEFDRELKRVVTKYCDPKFTGVQHSNTRGFKDSEIAYEIEFQNISVIRQRLNLTHQQAAGLAFAFSDQYGNPSVNDWGKYDSIHSVDTGEEYLACDFYKIPVFKCEFTDIDNEKYIKFNDKFGEERTKEYNGTIQDNEVLMQNSVRYIRQASWIPNTQYLFDYGKKEYIPRDAYKKPRTSYRAIRLMSSPILEQILPFIKGLNLAWIKAQNFISLAVANGLAVDIGALKNISIGKDKSWDVMELLSFYRQSSFLLYKKNVSLTGMGRYSQPPVIPINNNMSENIRAQFEAMDKYMQQIESVSGISMVSTGSTPDPNTAKFNMQVSMQGTNEIINSISRAQTDLQSDISVNLCYRIRSYCRVNPEVAKSYAEVIGERRMKAVIDAERNHVEYGINIEASDISEEKRNIMAMIQAAISPEGANSQGKLTPSEAIVVIDMIHQRQNLRRIGFVLGYMLRRKEKEMAAKQKAMIEIQGQQNKELEMIKAQAAEQARQFEFQKMQMQFWSEFTIKHGTPPPFQMMQPGSKQEYDKVMQGNNSKM